MCMSERVSESMRFTHVRICYELPAFAGRVLVFSGATYSIGRWGTAGRFTLLNILKLLQSLARVELRSVFCIEMQRTVTADLICRFCGPSQMLLEGSSLRAFV